MTLQPQLQVSIGCSGCNSCSGCSGAWLQLQVSIAGWNLPDRTRGAHFPHAARRTLDARAGLQVTRVCAAPRTQELEQLVGTYYLGYY